MAIIPLRIPAIGEGLQEARLVGVLKQPGDRVRRDEPIYQIETDKAVMDVESPHDGVITEWLVPVDTLLPIGGEVGRIEVVEAGQTEAPAAPVASSNETPLLIPQIGEGLQEARLVGVLKQPGDRVKRDEPIYQIETDKAVMDVESPFDGELVSWTVAVDTVLPIGAEVGRMKVEGAITPMAAGHGPAPTASIAAPVSAPAASPSGPRRTDIPPRTRAYAKEKGLTEDQLQTIPASGSKLMPADIDAFLAGRATAQVAAKSGTSSSGATFAEAPLSQKQRLLSSRLVRGTQLNVPGTITVQTLWEGIEARRAEYKAAGGDFQPSAFTMFAYAVAKALGEFPAFRSTLSGDSILRTYDHAQLGIAVALPGDELVLAVVPDADALDWSGFATKTKDQIALAREGKDQANEAVTVSLTNMQSFGLREAVPVVVPPSVATIFLSEVYKGLDQQSEEIRVRRYVNLAMTFDHRTINGVGAADFINRIKFITENIHEVVPGP